MLAGLRARLSYANVMATIALFVALGGTSWAVLKVGSRDVVNNSLRSADIRDNTVRSRDVRNRTLRGRDIRRNSLGGGAIKERALGRVPIAANADRVGGATVEQLRTQCPSDTIAQVGLCFESAGRPADTFLGAINRCDQHGRQLPSMPQLDAFGRSNGPLSGQGEWTSSVFRGGTDNSEPLEVVVLRGGAVVQYGEAQSTDRHAFRCVALPSN